MFKENGRSFEMIDRRGFGFALLASAAVVGAPAQAQAPTLSFLTAGPGSGFLSYGQGIAIVVNASGLVGLDVIETAGSIENLKRVEADPTCIGAAFIGSAYAAIHGVGPFAGKQHGALRAIAPMYETSYQAVAKAGRGINKAADLSGKRVGIGAAGEAAEALFLGLAELTGIAPIIVNGSSAELETALLADAIDAIWQGASLPVPSLARVAEKCDSVVFGLTDEELAAMLGRFPYLSEGDVAEGTYQGQMQPIRSVAAWNLIVANAALDEDVAYLLTREILGADTTPEGTTMGFAPKNRVVLWHPGAADFLREKGVAI